MMDVNSNGGELIVVIIHMYVPMSPQYLYNIIIKMS